MAIIESALARQLDVEVTETGLSGSADGKSAVYGRVTAALGRGAMRVDGTRRGLRLATPSGVLRGPDKYKELEIRRRRAQIRARHVLGLS